MKKLITIFLILFFTSVAFGQDVIVVKKKGAPDYYCDSCPDAIGGADVDCEVPDGTADGLCGWTIVETGGATGEIDFAATPDNDPALGCTDIPMTYTFSSTKTNTTATDLYGYKAVSGTTFYRQTYVKVTAEGLANSEVFTLFGFGRADQYGSVRISFYQDVSGNLKFIMEYHIAAGWQGDVGGTNISLDQWYGVRLYILDSTTDTIQWWVDYPNNGTWTDEVGVSGVTLDRALEVAMLGGSPDKTHIFYLTGDKIDDDTMPTACTR